MSQVLSALKRSEQAHQAQKNASQQAQTSKQAPKAANKLILAACLIVPISAALGAAIWQAQASRLAVSTNAHHSQPKAVESKQASIELNPVSSSSQLEQLKTLPKTSDDAQLLAANESLIYLKYPDFGHLDALPAPVTPKPVEKSQNVANKAQSAEPVIQEEDVDFSDISPALAAQLKAALQGGVDPSASNSVQTASDSNAIALDKNTNQFRGRLPAMNFAAHVYVSDPAKRWVKVNGREVKLGEWLVPNEVKLEKMTPRDLVASFRGQYILIPALYEWQG